MSQSRRRFLSAASLLPTICLERPSTVKAQSPVPSPTLYDREIYSIVANAQNLKLTVPAAAPGQGLAGAELDLADLVDQAVRRTRSDEDEASDLAMQAGTLLSALTRAGSDEGLPDDAQAPPPNFVNLSKGYRSMFDDSQTTSKVGSVVRRAATQICSPSSFDIYRECEKTTQVPWYVIGAIHYREANLNFMGHLHNGDFLRIKTIHVPKHQPKGQWPPQPWVPRSAWLTSAEDALRSISGPKSWTVERMLYRLEGYNGFGYRYHVKGDGTPYESPYLWNFTQFYSEGGYARDGKWSSSYVSRQVGLVPLLKQIQALRPSDVLWTYE